MKVLNIFAAISISGLSIAEGTSNNKVVDAIPPSTRSRGGTDKLFSEEETAEFNKLFKDLMGSTPAIILRLEAHRSLKHLVKRFTL